MDASEHKPIPPRASPPRGQSASGESEGLGALSRLRTLGGLGGSLLLHAALLFWVLEKAPDLRPPDFASETTLRGSTFEMDLSVPLTEAAVDSSAAARALPDASPSASKAAEPVESETSSEPSKPAEPPSQTGAEKPAPARERVRPPVAKTRPKPAPESASPSAESAAPSTPKASAAPSSAGRASEGGSTYGAAGAAQGRLSLLRSFVKILPLAAKLVPEWLSTDLGVLSPVLAELRVNTEGQLVEIEILKGSSSRLVAESVRRSQIFLRSGRFIGAEGVANRLVVSIRGTVSMKASSEESEASEKVVAMGQRLDPAKPSAPPTGAYFTFGSGRHVELEVEQIDVLE